jgi:hypothetical protein
MNSNYRWEPVIPLPDEHRLFPLHGNPFKWVAIADNSGVSPDQTDDGVLWLDFDWNLIISGPDGVLCIPVKRANDGERFSIVTNMSTMLYLSATFNWPIEDQLADNMIYKVNS